MGRVDRCALCGEVTESGLCGVWYQSRKRKAMRDARRRYLAEEEREEEREERKPRTTGQQRQAVRCRSSRHGPARG